jgi:hypothetical protein
MEIGAAGVFVADGAEEELTGGEDRSLAGTPDDRKKRRIRSASSRVPVRGTSSPANQGREKQLPIKTNPLLFA